MSELYPLKFSPVFKEKIWGGKRIHSHFGMDFSPLANCGEAWLLSGYKHNVSVVSNGFLAGNALDELIEIYMGDLVGEKVYEKFDADFPLLIKILDSTDWLSIQVHPDDEAAKEMGLANGKTEMWYVAEAAGDAQLINGFEQKVSPGHFIEAVELGRLEGILHYENAKSGDVFDIPAGRVHALGPGLLIFEIQQSSDSTFRIYDFGRLGDDGKPRDLHTAEALKVLDFNSIHLAAVDYPRIQGQTVPLVQNEYFCTRLMHFGTSVVKDYSGLDSFVVLLCVEGSCILSGNGTDYQLNAGELVLIPATLEQVELTPQPLAKVLEIYHP